MLVSESIEYFMRKKNPKMGLDIGIKSSAHTMKIREVINSKKKGALTPTEKWIYDNQDATTIILPRNYWLSSGKIQRGVLRGWLPASGRIKKGEYPIVSIKAMNKIRIEKHKAGGMEILPPRSINIKIKFKAPRIVKDWFKPEYKYTDDTIVIKELIAPLSVLLKNNIEIK